MHYGNDIQLEQNYLEFVIYACKNPGLYDEPEKYNKDKFTFELSSIQNCHLVPPYFLKEFLHTYKYLLQDYLFNIKDEDYYYFRLRFTGYDIDLFVVEELRPLTDEDPSIYFIH